jgi:hypothetical protein
MSGPSYVVCPVCKSDHFLLSRRLYLLTLEGGAQQRNWASGENSSNEVVCASCQSRLRWNVETDSYVVFETAAGQSQR